MRLSEENYEKGRFSYEIFVAIKNIYWPFRKKILFLVFLGLAGRLLLLGNTNLIGAWVDHKFTTWTDTHYALSLLSFSLLGFLFSIFYRIGFSRISAQAVSTFYDEVTLRTSRYPMPFFDHTPVGRIITRFSSDYGNLFRWFGGPLAEFLAIIFDMISILILITLASPIFLLFLVLIGSLSFLIYKRNVHTLRVYRRNLSASRSPSISHFAETTQGASTIRIFQRVKEFTDRFLNLDTYYQTQKKETLKRILFFSFQMGSFSAFLFLFVALTSVFFVNNGVLSIGAIGTAFGFILMSTNTMLSFFDWLAQFEEALVGLERLNNYLLRPIEQGNLLPSKVKLQTQHPIYNPSVEKYLHQRKFTSHPSASVEVNDLWFKYNEHSPWILNGVSFQVQPGERLGIVGKTGSGKSTLIQCIFYLYPLQKGFVSINNKKPKIELNENGVDLNLYRKSISYISQTPTLFQGTIRDNLDISNEFSDGNLFQVLARVGLVDWTNLQMKIEENGKNLSLGERQLLCMARALLQNAPVIIMDEATSAVDPQSEELMVKATEEFFKDRTQIIIAHRLSTLRQCHRILWLDQGQIVDIGPTEKVLSSFLALPN